MPTTPVKKEDFTVADRQESIQHLISHLNPKKTQQILTMVLQQLLQAKIEEAEIRELLESADTIHLPISIFFRKLSILESICKYLKEERGLRYVTIAQSLQRDQRTIWTTYRNSKRKHPSPLKLEDAKFFIPLSIFQQRRHSAFEILTAYLHEEKQLRYVDIANLLGRDQRTIWTTYQRYCKKHER